MRSFFYTTIVNIPIIILFSFLLPKPQPHYVYVCLCDACDACCVRAMKLLRRRCKKKTEERFLSVRYFFLSFSFFVRTRGETEKEKHNTRKREREREREREHNTRAHHHSLDFLSSSSLICIKEIERKSG